MRNIFWSVKFIFSYSSINETENTSKWTDIDILQAVLAGVGGLVSIIALTFGIIIWINHQRNYYFKFEKCYKKYNKFMYFYKKKFRSMDVDTSIMFKNITFYFNKKYNIYFKKVDSYYIPFKDYCSLNIVVKKIKKSIKNLYWFYKIIIKNNIRKDNIYVKIYQNWEDFLEPNWENKVIENSIYDRLHPNIISKNLKIPIVKNYNDWLEYKNNLIKKPEKLIAYIPQLFDFFGKKYANEVVIKEPIVADDKTILRGMSMGFDANSWINGLNNGIDDEREWIFEVFIFLVQENIEFEKKIWSWDYRVLSSVNKKWYKRRADFSIFEICEIEQKGAKYFAEQIKKQTEK
ncbi:hypothetical protein SSYRP_v1c04570 [Spiroplasma syrphidicola EA-1]|uniref:Uncharacterized protein n=1 Tax=Spiroplasma syrphidicola EA-1 TaxID=1276229 RepID=R4UDS3_9MOLU|nr:hypothetical protein [Spiroplasma syrphidicola]AGM26049.1 hypothetical protein SSYRP_v1c04570 [Spiroplasma syrphidicola EA-1]